MTLIACPDCAHPVSPHAPTCPKCGAPIARSKRGQFPGFAIVVAGAIAVLANTSAACLIAGAAAIVVGAGWVLWARS